MVGDQLLDGFILHVVRPAEDGYELLEVWDSRDQFDAFNRNYVLPAMQELGIPPEPPPEMIEFEPWGVQVGHLYDSHATVPG